MNSRMTFEKFGRAHHLRICSAADLEHVISLDEAHWVATGAPTISINEDAEFLDYLDIDDNKRIMCFELQRASRWLLDTLTDHSDITAKSNALNLKWVNRDTEDGTKIITAANKMLRELRIADSSAITLKQVRQIKSKVGDSPTCHAGIATAQAADDPKIKEFISDMINTVGGLPEEAAKNEDKGITTEKLTEFLAEASARIEWHKKTAIPTGKRNTDLMPLGNNTHSAYQALINVREKIDQYFAQCEAVAFDPRVGDHIKPNADSLQQGTQGDMPALKEFMKDSPLSFPEQHQMLRFSDPINPYYATMLQRFRVEVMMPVLNQSMKNLSKEDWLTIKDTFTQYESWHKDKKGEAVESLGLEKLHVYQDERFKAEVSRIIGNSNKTALVLDNINLVEKIILYQANIIDLANNFVSFPHLYNPDRRAAFEMGTLIIDGRRLNFSVKVSDINLHSSIAKTSDIFIIYAEITLENNKDKYIVAVPVTAGTKGNLCIGKRGIFCDLRGKLLDAKVIDIIENPISVGETLIAPFQRIGKLLTGKIEAMTTAAEKKLDTAVSAPQQQGNQSKSLMAGGLLMGGGVAFAAVASSAAFLIKTIGSLGAAKTIGGLTIAIAAVIAPASIIALMKLRRRDLSAILEGVGWAINARMRLTFKQGHMFTDNPPLPKKARVMRSGHWLLWTLLLITLTIWILKIALI